MNAQQAKQLVEQFDLVTAHCQMSIGVLKSGHVVALYLGERLPEKTSLGAVITDIGRASYLAVTDRIPDFRLEQLPLVYPAFGTTDMRAPAIDVVGVDGSRVLDLRFCKAHWLVTKKRPDGLPATRPSEGQKTLALTMADPTTGVAVTLYIDADRQHDTFTQHVEIQNTGSQNLHLKRAMSWSWDILDDQEQLLTLNGAWGREAQPHIRPLQPGIQGVDSKRGASGHGQNPFIGLIDATNNRVLSADLVYSGDFVASAEVDMHQNTRVQLGISPWQFDWVLTPGAIFTTPEAVVVWQKAGIQAISQPDLPSILSRLSTTERMVT